MKASDLFVKCLEEEGIEYIFGVPGEENADFMMSLQKSTRIKFVLTRHEQGAAFMLHSGTQMQQEHLSHRDYHTQQASAARPGPRGQG